ncbi:MAG: hypothetical protein IPQ07_26520 [Myxococcales bacterium]|nr:hypothetical protein [Myxococcales bacterium]
MTGLEPEGHGECADCDESRVAAGLVEGTETALELCANCRSSLALEDTAQPSDKAHGGVGRRAGSEDRVKGGFERTTVPLERATCGRVGAQGTEEPIAHVEAIGLQREQQRVPRYAFVVVGPRDGMKSRRQVLLFAV